MARQSKRKILQQIKEVHQDRWDRIRRNPEYIKDHSQFVRLYSNSDRIKTFSRADRASRFVVRFRKKWKLSWPISPNEDTLSTGKGFQDVSLVFEPNRRRESILAPVSEDFFKIREPSSKRRVGCAGPSNEERLRKESRPAQLYEVLENGTDLHLVLDMSAPINTLEFQIKKAFKLIEKRFKSSFPKFRQIRTHLKKNKEVDCAPEVGEFLGIN